MLSERVEAANREHRRTLREEAGEAEPAEGESGGACEEGTYGVSSSSCDDMVGEAAEITCCSCCFRVRPH